MSKSRFQCCWAIVCLFSTFLVQGQCTFSLTAASNCLPAYLNVSPSDQAISKIVWKKDNGAYGTSYMSWQKKAKVIMARPNTEQPSDVFVDGAGNIYVCIVNTNTVLKFAAGASTPTVVAGGNGQGSGANQFNAPSGIYVDVQQNLYVADELNHRVQKWAPGASSGVTVAGGNGAGSALNQLRNPKDIFVTSNGSIYIADHDNHRIQRWAAGAVTGVMVAGTGVSGSADNQLAWPKDVSVDASGNMCIIHVNKLTRWAAGATTGVQEGYSSVGQSQYSTTKILVDPIGSVFHTRTNAIRRFYPRLPTGFEDVILDANQLTYIGGIGMDAKGNLYVADVSAYGFRILRFDVNTNMQLKALVAGSYAAEVTTLKNCTSVTNAITVSASSGPTLDITVPNTLVCEGSVNSFTTSITNAGVTPVYAWRKNNSTVGSNNFSYTASDILNGDTIFCTVTNSGNGCYGSDTVVMKVKRAAASGVITTTSNCMPANLMFSGLSPSRIIWKKDGAPVDTSRVTWNLKGRVVAGGNGKGNAANQFDMGFTSDMEVDATGNIYVLDQANARIMKYAPGAVSGIVVAGGNGDGTAASQLNSPQDFCLDASGNLIVAELNRITKWIPGSPEGLTVMDNTRYSNFLYPKQVFVDKKGSLYAAGSPSSTNIMVIKISEIEIDVLAGFNGLGSAANQFGYEVGGIFVDEAENIFVSDLANHRVQKWAKGATTGVTVAGNGVTGSGDNQLSDPQKIFIDGANNLFIADAGNGRIQKRNLGTGIIETVVDTSLVDVSLYSLTLDTDNNIYVADATRNQVMKFTAGINRSFKASAGNYSVEVAGVNNGCYTPTNVVAISNSAAPSIVLNAKAVCEGDASIVTAVLTNGGTAPVIQWRKNGSTVPGNSLSISESSPVSGDRFGLLVTNNANGCYQRDSIAISVKPLPAVSLTASTNGLPATITLQSNAVLPQIAWSLNNAALDTTHNWKANGETVASFPGPAANRFTPHAILAAKDSAFYSSGDDLVPVNGRKGYLWRHVLDKQAPAPVYSIEYNSGFEDIEQFNDSLYLLSSISNTVWRVPLNGKGLPTFVAGRYKKSGSADSLFFQPTKIALDNLGNIYVADATNRRVMKWSRGDTVGVAVASGEGPGKFNGTIAGLSVDENQNLYMTDNSLLFKWPAGAAQKTVLYNLANLDAVSNWRGNFRDPQGNIYVASQTGVVKYNPANNHVTYVAGNNGFGSAANQFNQPMEISLDQYGNMFVADFNNYRVQLFTADQAKTRQVSTAGLYKVIATDYNGCTVTDSVRVLAGTYTFIGPGTDWNNAAYWQNGITPPASALPLGYLIFIDPADGECILNGNLTIAKGAYLRVAGGKKLTVKGKLTLQ